MHKNYILLARVGNNGKRLFHKYIPNSHQKCFYPMGAGVSGDMKDTAEDHSTHPKREKGDIVSRTFFDLVILIYGLLQKT